MLRHLLVALLLLLTIGPVAAQDVPSFFIESIEIRNNERVSPDVIIAESRLRPGRSYSEQELREASDRVNRLRFLLSAELSLEKGSVPDTHRLVMTVNETRVFFFSIDARFFLEDDGLATVDTSEDVGGSVSDVALGWRFFVGRRGAVHFGLVGNSDNLEYTPDYTSVAVGYTQYDLFGTQAFATINLKKPIAPGDSSISPQLTVGIPLTPRQTLTLNYDSLDLTDDGFYYIVPPPGSVERPERREFERKTDYDLLRATWSHNTTNNPFFPTRGEIFSASVTTLDAERTFLRWYRQPEGYYNAFPVTEDTRTNTVEASARAFRELSERNSVSAGVSAGFANNDVQATVDEDRDADTAYGRVLLSFSRNLRDPAAVARSGESLLVADLRLRVTGNEADDLLFDGSLHEDGLVDDSGYASFSWVRRNAWGTWRLGLGYAW